MEEKKFMLEFSPHIRDNSSTMRIMLDVLLALLPASAASVWFFGLPALLNIILAVAAAVVCEGLIQYFCKKKVTVCDLSAAVTGLLLALNLPAGTPWYVPVCGAVFAIAICKQCFGGLGHNFINPALAARAFLMLSWPLAMTTYVAPSGVDAVASATPLALMQAEEIAELPSLLQMFLGQTTGAMGETCAAALLLGGIYLMVRKVISPRIPLIFLGTTAVFLLIFNGPALLLENMLSGGLLLGAFFMATDYVTSPVTPLAQAIYAFGCGLLVAVIRTFGGYAEGVCFAILIMNLAAPLIERFCQPRIYGEAKK